MFFGIFFTLFLCYLLFFRNKTCYVNKWKRKIKNWQKLGLIDNKTAENILNFEKNLLLQKTAQWQNDNLITKDQTKSIISYEENKKKFSFVISPIYVLGIVGILTIGLGIISLVSANWMNTPVFAKFMGMLILLLINDYFINKFNNKKPIIFELLLFLHSGLLLAFIGLVSQIYNLSMPLYMVLITWSVLNIPILFYTKKNYFYYFWEILLTVGIFTSPLVKDLLDRIFSGRLNIMVFSQGALLVYLLFRKIPIDKKALIPLNYLFIFLIIEPLFEIKNPGNINNLLIITGLLSVALYLVISKIYKSKDKIPYIICLLYFLFPLAINSYLVFGLELAIMICSLIFFSNQKSEKLMHLTSILILFRVLCAFENLLGNLIQTGIDLIIAGLVMLFLVYSLIKKNKKLLKDKNHD
ncbi:MAG: DUF2157 domain-containing protein [Alphaproteobacteria bacterium]|nr:DUF2157 domain-containing protein [Alphaproteobacteria bacterium]